MKRKFIHNNFPRKTHSRNNRLLLCKSILTRKLICITRASGYPLVITSGPSVSKINRKVRSLDQTESERERICQNSSLERPKWKDNIFLSGPRGNFTPLPEIHSLHPFAAIILIYGYIIIAKILFN